MFIKSLVLWLIFDIVLFYDMRHFCITDKVKHLCITDDILSIYETLLYHETLLSHKCYDKEIIINLITIKTTIKTKTYKIK